MSLNYYNKVLQIVNKKQFVIYLHAFFLKQHFEQKAEEISFLSKTTSGLGLERW